MKALQISFLAIIMVFSAKAENMEFFKGSWEEVLAHAKTENKLIFVDIYATWCGPCKWMERNVFTDKTVGNYYNQNFVNYRIDGEREELILIESLDIEAYPTLVYFNSEGELIRKEVGGLDQGEFVSLGRKVKGFTSKVPEVRNKKEYADYIMMLASSNISKANTMASEYIQVNKNLLDEQGWTVLKSVVKSTSHEYFDKVMSGMEKYVEMTGFISYFSELFDNSVTEAVEMGDVSTLNVFKDFEYQVRKVLGMLEKPRKAYDLETDAAFYRESGMMDEYLKTVDQWLSQYYFQDAETLIMKADEANEIFGAAAANYSLKWGKRALKLEESVYVNFMLATIYESLGENSNAKIYAKKAEQMADDHNVKKQITQYIDSL